MPDANQGLSINPELTAGYGQQLSQQTVEIQGLVGKSTAAFTTARQSSLTSFMDPELVAMVGALNACFVSLQESTEVIFGQLNGLVGHLGGTLQALAHDLETMDTTTSRQLQQPGG